MCGPTSWRSASKSKAWSQSIFLINTTFNFGSANVLHEAGRASLPLIGLVDNLTTAVQRLQPSLDLARHHLERLLLDVDRKS